MKTSLKKAFAQKAHSLKPVVLIGAKGLTEGVHLEIDRALHDHELIKIKLPQMERSERQMIAEEICSRQGASLIKVIGRTAIIYRERKD